MTEQAAEDAPLAALGERMHSGALALAEERLAQLQVTVYDVSTRRRLRRAFYGEAALELLAYSVAKAVTESGDQDTHSQTAVWILVDHVERLAQFGDPG